MAGGIPRPGSDRDQVGAVFAAVCTDLHWWFVCVRPEISFGMTVAVSQEQG